MFINYFSFIFVIFVIQLENTFGCSSYYTVKSGDYLSKIATDHGITYDYLVSINPKLNTNNNLYVGDLICVDISTSSTTTTIKPVVNDNKECSEYYTVESGDYLYKIATDHGITLDYLLSLNNNLNYQSVLYVGQLICIKNAVKLTTTLTTTLSTSKSSCFLVHTVQKGDYLFMVAELYGTTVDNLIANNDFLIFDRNIYEGQKICIFDTFNSMLLNSLSTQSPSTTTTFPSSITTTDTSTTTPSTTTTTLTKIKPTTTISSTTYSMSSSMFTTSQILITSIPSTIMTSLTSTLATTTISSTKINEPSIKTNDCEDGCVVDETTKKPCEYYYSVKSGDYLYKIAVMYDVTIDYLYNLNEDLKTNSNLHIGQRICVNIKLENEIINDNQIELNIPEYRCKLEYLTESGDNCITIALKNNLTIDRLIELNKDIRCEDMELDVSQPICILVYEKLVTRKEFENAFRLNGYPIPSYEKYINFVNSAEADGGITSKRELAMFLAQLIWESGGLVYTEELACMSDGCPDHYRTDNDYPDKDYYGRGYIQLTWSYNYLSASLALYNDLRLYLDPSLVSKNDSISWAVSFWYWKEYVHPQEGISDGHFGVSTKAINGFLECFGGPYEYKARIRYELYRNVLKAFNINEKPIENGCYEME